RKRGDARPDAGDLRVQRLAQRLVLVDSRRVRAGGVAPPRRFPSTLPARRRSGEVRPGSYRTAAIRRTRQRARAPDLPGTWHGVDNFPAHGAISAVANPSREPRRREEIDEDERFLTISPVPRRARSDDNNRGGDSWRAYS